MSGTSAVGRHTVEEANAHFFQWLRRMRDEEPTSYDPTTHQWHLFRHTDVTFVMSHPEIFVSDMADITPPQEDYDIFFRGNIAAMDEPRHREFRSIVSKEFSARYIANLEPRVTQIATGLLDEIGDRKKFDLAADFAFPLPVTVIAEILGAPKEDRHLFAEWANLLHASNVGAEGHRATAMRLRSLNTYVFELIRQRRADPRGDLITKLTQANRHDGNPLEDEEIVGFAGVLLMGGITTTAALISNIVLTFDRFPDLYQEVRADRSLIPQAIEEVVRIRPSFSNFVRMTDDDVTMNGETIPAGSLVHVWVSSANRDATAFPDPDRFDIHRDPNRHLGFGQGIHYCIGAPLARLESRIAFNLLLDRYREIRVVPDADIKFLDTSDMIGASRLPVTVIPD